MATVPDVPSPSVVPQGALSVNAPRAAFGDSSGLEALSKTLGVSADVISQHVLQQRAVINKMDAVNAGIQMSQEQGTFLEQHQQENQGERAEAALPGAYKQLEAIRTAAASTLTSPDAQEMFAAQSRISTLEATQKLANWTGQQTRAAQNQKLDASADVVVHDATAENFDTATTATLGTLLGMKAAYNGLDPVVAKAELYKQLGSAAYNVTAGLAGKDWAAAQAFYDKHADLMSPGQKQEAQAQITSAKQNHSIMSTVDDLVSTNLNGGVPKPQLPPATGQVAPGNLDPWNRPILHNKDGSYSTTVSISVGTPKGEVLIPTVVDGKKLTNQQAIDHWKKTGESFGTFDTPEHADAYATELHNRQAQYVQDSGQLAGPVTAKYGPAIAAGESAGKGNYTAIGPVTKTGDHGYGRYQVMGSNIPVWTQEVLGKRMTPREFLDNPQAQDAVFEAKFGGMVQEYGSPQEAASVWFTGHPLAQGAALKDTLGTTGAQYVSKFNAALGGVMQGGAGRDTLKAMSPAEQLTETLPATLAHIDATITDPVERERVRTEYIQRVERARNVENLVQKDAKDRILSAGDQLHTSDLAQIGTAYPGANADIAKFSEHGKANLQRQLTTDGNVENAVNVENYRYWVGLLNGPNGAQFAGTKIDNDPVRGVLTSQQSNSLFKMQQSIIKQENRAGHLSPVNLQSALANPLVATEYNKMKPDQQAVFSGALVGEIEQAQAAKKGKLNPIEVGQLAANLVAQRTARGITYDFGIFPHPGSTFQRPTYEVPEQWEADFVKTWASRSPEWKAVHGQTPTPATIAYYYHGGN